MYSSNHSANRLFITALISSGLLLPVAALADQAGTAKPRGIGIGLNIDNSPEAYQALDNEYKGVITPLYQGQRFNMDGESITYRIVGNDKLWVEALGKAQRGGFEKDNYSEMTGLKDRKESFNVGARVHYGNFRLDATTDASSKHKGHEVSVHYGEAKHQPWTGKREVKVSPIAGVVWQSDEVVDYYYGVDASETTSSRSAFTGKSTLTPYIGMQANANLSRSVSLNASVAYHHVPDEITDSPITDDDHDVRFNAGIAYWF